MSLSVDIRFTGDRELALALSTMDRAVQRRLVTTGLSAAAQPTLALARELAPKRSGRLAASLTIKPLKSRRSVGVRIVAGTRSRLGIRKNATGYYPAHQEFGSRRNRKQAYLKPAADRTRTFVLNTMATHIWSAIRAHMREQGVKS